MAKKPRRRSLPITAKSKRVFLAALAEGWTRSTAAQKSGVDKMRWLQLINKNQFFARRVERAIAAGIDALEDEAHRRAVKGVACPVVSGGRIVTYKKNYSDMLLSKALEARSKTYAKTTPGATVNFDGAAERLLIKLNAIFSGVDGSTPDAG